MIESLLRRNPDGSWDIPNIRISELIENQLRSCAEKCDQTIQRLQLLCSGRVGAEDFNIDLSSLRGRITIYTDRIKPFRQIEIQDLERKALTGLIVELAVAVRELKGLNTNLLLFDAADRVFVDHILEVLTQAVGEVPKNFFHSKTDQLSQSIRVLSYFSTFCESLEQFKEQTLALSFHPSLAISFSSDDREFATLITDLLKKAMKNVLFVEDFGPYAGRKIGEFQGLFHSVDFILVIGSSSYGRKVQSEAPNSVKSESLIIAERFSKRAEHVISLLVEGSPETSLPSIMAHGQVGHLTARSPVEIFSAVLEILTRVYYGRADAPLNDLKVKLLDLAASSSSIPVEPLMETQSRALNTAPLVSVYREKGHLTRFFDKKPFPIDKSYINLAIVDQESYEEREKKSRPLDRLSAEGAFFDKPNCVELSRLFDGYKRVYVEGNAGSGKSTLCHYLAFSWATLEPTERLQALGPWANQYEAVVWIPLREIQTLSKEAKLSDLIQKLYPGFVIDACDRDKTLFILDGFDEVVSIEEVCKNSEEDKRWEIVSSLIDQTQWLMTSRPGIFSERFSTSRRLKNLGFTESNIKSYIQRFSEDFGMAGDDLEKAVWKSDDLKTLAHVPFYLELVCSLWKSNHAILNNLNNPVALYDEMAVYLFRRHIERLQRKPFSLPNNRVLDHKDVQLYRLSLEKIAFISRQAGSNKVTPAIYLPIFDRDPLKSLSDEHLQDFGKGLFEDLGLFARRGDAKMLFDQDYAFLHPTFEEYFAACHVASAIESSELLANSQTASEWFKANYLLKEKELLIDFIASLAKTEKQLCVVADELTIDLKTDVDSNGWQYPLHQSSSIGLLSLCKILVSKGVIVDSENKQKSQPLRMAAENGHKEVVRLLLEKGAKVDAAGKNGWQALHSAAENGHKEVVDLLLRKGAKVDANYKNGSQALHIAARNGHKEVVGLLLQKGAKVDAAKNDGWQALHLAAENGHKEVVRLLLEKGAKVDASKENGWQALHSAAQNGYIEVVELLLQKGAKVDAAKNDGWQALHLAAENGRKEVVGLLLEKGAKVDAAKDNGWQALHSAAQNGHKEVVRLLLEKGAKVDASKENGWQALHSAAQNDHKEVVELLLQKGAKVDAAKNNGYQALHLAAENGCKEVVDLLLQKGAKVDTAINDSLQALHIATRNGYKEVVELLLQKGAKVDAAKNGGWQALHIAAEKGHKEVIELLLLKGAKVDAAKDNGWQALHSAAQNGHKEVVELLLQKGAKVDAAKNDGCQALHLAAENGRKEVVRLLLEKGVKVDATKENGSQALHSAAQNGHKEVVELLLQKGAKVDTAKKDGSQALHLAAQKDHKEVVELLLQKGARIDAAKNDGTQPIHVAAYSGHKEIVELLLTKGANVNAANKNGKKPAGLATEMGHTELAKILQDSSQV